MGKKKMVMRRLAALLATSLVLTSSAFTSLAAVTGVNAGTKLFDTHSVVVGGDNSVEVGKSIKLTVTATATSSDASPEEKAASAPDATRAVEDMLKNIEWTSNDPEKATVDEEGKVTGVAEGDVTITASVAGLTGVFGTKKIKVTATTSEDKPTEGPTDKPTEGPTDKPTEAPEQPTPTIPPIDPGLVDSEDHTENDKAVVDAIVNVEGDLPGGIQVSEVDTTDVEGELTAKDAEKVAQDTVVQTKEIKENLDSFDHDEESAAQAASVVPVQTQVAAVDVTSEAAAAALEEAGLAPEDLSNVKVKVAIDAPKVKTKVTKGLNGEVVTTVVVVQATFNIDLVATNSAGEEKKVPLAQMGNTTRFTVPLILPENVDDSANWALITHILDNGNRERSKCRIRTSNGQKYIKIVGSHFSPFEITFSADEPENVTNVEALENNAWREQTTGGYSGGGRSSGGSRPASNNTIAGTLSGQWQMNETGWWFRLDDGSYAVNSWQYVAYNGAARWYRFDANGYICKGWFTDADGHRYYLNPVSDGLMGSMLTGWQQIDGIWYYFNTASDGTQGALLVNTTTPDGYNVDANGQWIQ